MLIRQYILLGLLAVLAVAPVLSAVHIVTSTTDLAAIAREIGGGRVQVESLARADQDLHRVEPRPSFVTQLAKAQLVVRVGMDLDTWMDGLLRAARNAQVRPGGKGYVDAAQGITALEVPQGKVDGAQGDIHVYGNPHYWLDPANGKIIARNILAGVIRVDPQGAEGYRQNYERFCQRIDTKLEEWAKRMAPLRGMHIVTYHTTWSYFNQRFGLKVVGTVESKPGIPPSGEHVSGLIATMKREGAKAVLTTAYYPTRFTDVLKRETQAAVVVLPTSVEGAKDYCSLFERTLDLLLGVKK